MSETTPKDKTQRNIVIALICVTIAFCVSIGFLGMLMTQILLSNEFNKGYNASNIAWMYHVNRIKLPIDGRDIQTVEKRKEGVKKDEATNIQR